MAVPVIAKVALNRKVRKAVIRVAIILIAVICLILAYLFGSLFGLANEAFAKSSSNYNQGSCSAPTGAWVPAGPDATGYNQSIVNIAYEVAVQRGASDRVVLALIETGIVETGMRNLANDGIDHNGEDYTGTPVTPASIAAAKLSMDLPHDWWRPDREFGSDHASVNFLQQQPWWAGPDWETDPLAAIKRLMDPAFATGKFLDSAIDVDGQYGPEVAAGTLAQKVQQSNRPDAYNQHEGEAQELLAVAKTAYANRPTTTTTTTAAPGGTPGSSTTTTAAPAGGVSCNGGDGNWSGQTKDFTNVDGEFPDNGQTYTVKVPDGPAGIAVSAALSQLGVRYSWGGGNMSGPTVGIRDGANGDAHNDYATPGFDCSGLMEYAWGKALNRSIGDYTGSQVAMNPEVTGDKLPGDLVFWAAGDLHHVAMYLGDGLIVEAPQSGTVVHIRPITSHSEEIHSWHRPQY